MAFKNYYRLMLNMIGKAIFAAAAVAAFLETFILFA